MTVIGWVIYPFIYPFYDGIYYGKKVPWWWFLNSDEPTFDQNKYGADWWLEKKKIRLDYWHQRFISSYRWNAIRNSIYTLKLKLVPNKGEKKNIKIKYNTTQGDGLVFCNEVLTGRQLAVFEIGGQKQFRISATFRLLWWVQNYQLGMSDKRYLYKLRFWKRKNINLKK